MIIVLTLSSIVSKAQVDSVGTRKLMMNINGSALKIPYFSNHSLDTTCFGCKIFHVRRVFTFFFINTFASCFIAV